MNDLFIGGGGYGGVMFVGVLEYLHVNKLLDIKNFYGTSIGSLLGIFYYCMIMIIGSYFILNLLLAVIIDSF